MFSSVRARLTAWYVGVLCLVLVGFSAGVYTLVSRKVHRDLDRELAAAIDVLARSLRHEIAEHEGKQPGEESFTTQVLATVYRDSFPGIAIAVYEDRRLVGSKPGPQGFVPPPAANKEAVLEFEDVERAAEPWRVAAQTVTADNAGSYQFIATASLLPVEQECADLRGILYVSIPLALLCAAAGGFLLARKSLAPVVAMSEAADRIGSKDLSRRLEIGNPKDELGKLGSTLNRLLSRLESSFEQQRQFMADSSHELRTPIYIAHTAAQVTLEQEGRAEPEYREAIAAIDQQLKRLQHLVEDMFILARADSGAYPLRITTFDLGETIGESVRAGRLLGHGRAVAVAGPEPAELPCTGDERLIRRLIMILLDNAIKYSAEGGRVSLSVDSVDSRLYRLAVSDTGPGIPAEAQPRIFDRFFRADPARSSAASRAGAGLGLAIAKWIAEIHGGSLKLIHTCPQGSTFQASFLIAGTPHSPTGTPPVADHPPTSHVNNR